MDALLLSTEPEVRYFTGFLTPFWQSPTRPWFLVIPLHGKPIAVVPGIGGSLMAATWIEDIRTWESPRPEDEGISLLADTLLSVTAGGRGRIGIPKGPETFVRMPLSDLERLQSLLPGLSFTDAQGIIKTLRMVKSEAEIEKIERICRIASDSFDSVPRLVSSGAPLAEVFRAFKLELLTQGADDVPYLVGASAPNGYDNVIAPPGNDPLQSGDVLMMDTGSVFDGYFCDFDRNYAIDRASDAARRGYDTLYRATEAGIKAARPGATAADLYHSMLSVMEGDGYQSGNVGRLGHGLGMQLTEWPSHTHDDLTVLVPGMVITLEPGLYIAPGTSMVHEENLVIREHGAELLSRRAAEELLVLT